MEAHSGVKAASGWLGILERHPTAWFVVGLALVLLAEGSIRVSFGDSGLSLLPPVDAPLKAALRILGFSLAVVFTYVYLLPRIGHPRVLLAGFLFVWLITIGLCIYAYIDRDDNALKATYWNFDLDRQMFTVRLTPAALRIHEGKYLVLVVREIDQRTGIREDPNVVMSMPFSLQQLQREMEYSIDMSSRSGYLSLGDWIECQVIVVPKKDDIAGAKLIEDLLKKGGQELFSDPPRQVLALQQPTVPALMRIIAGMDPLERERLLSKLREI